MRKILSIALVMAGLALTNNVTASNYILDETAVTTLLNTATEESFESIAAFSTIENKVVNVNTAVASDKSKGVFLVTAFFCGGFAIHRFYMGTGGNGGIIFISNFCLLGVPALIDFIYVLIDDANFSKYDNSKEVFIWAGKK